MYSSAICMKKGEAELSDDYAPYPPIVSRAYLKAFQRAAEKSKQPSSEG